MTKPNNLVIDRAMRAAFKAWQDDMVSRGQTSALNAKFDDIAPRDRRLIELQCRAAIASLREPSDGMKKAATESSHYGYPVCFNFIIDAALKP